MISFVTLNVFKAYLYVFYFYSANISCGFPKGPAAVRHLRIGGSKWIAEIFLRTVTGCDPKSLVFEQAEQLLLWNPDGLIQEEN